MKMMKHIITLCRRPCCCCGESWTLGLALAKLDRYAKYTLMPSMWACSQDTAHMMTRPRKPMQR